MATPPGLRGEAGFHLRSLQTGGHEDHICLGKVLHTWGLGAEPWSIGELLHPVALTGSSVALVFHPDMLWTQVLLSQWAGEGQALGEGADAAGGGVLPKASFPHRKTCLNRLLSPTKGLGTRWVPGDARPP